MRPVSRLLAFFFHHLYHSLAFAYDAVAAVVSFGQWIKWTKATLPFVQVTRVLELGHGPGHLQRLFPTLGLFAVGLDESAPMGRLARRRLVRAGNAHPNLVRGLGQSLPFPAETFDSLVSTFPAPYITEPLTLSEAHRVLRNGGRLIVLPAAWPRNPLLKWLYHVTGESPAQTLEIIKEKWSQPFVRAGFEVRVETVEVKSSGLLFIIATK
jgi:ubiquinone/menaquinone biosynthesis C-methylase UbiE